jgi:hypothetical protein
MRKHIFVAGFIMASSIANAGSITDYSLTGDIVTNSATGLEWLDWDVTRGQSVYWLMTDMGVDAKALRDGGWEMASNAQVAGLFNDFGFGGLVWDTVESTSQSAGTRGSVGSVSHEDAFIALFGDQHASAGLSEGWPINPRSYANAYFGRDGDDDGFVNFVGVNSDYRLYKPGLGGGIYYFDPLFHLTEDAYRTSWPENDVGIALTRTVVEEVPEPSSVALLAIGLAGLGISRRNAR